MSGHQNENAVFGFDSVPFLATSFEDSAKLFEAARPTMEELLDEQNLVMLYAVPWPPQGLYFNKEVNAVADMEGLKFRSYNNATARLAELTGMLPVTIEAAEISQAFATGVAESMVSSGATGYDRKVWESLSHFYEVNAWLPYNYVMVNKEIWNDTSDADKGVISGCAQLAEYAGKWRAREYTGFTVNGLAAGGMTVAPAGDELVAELQEIGATMTEEWLEAAGDNGKAIMEAYQASK
jgi:TRAP-type C4-dicarboxylate transport system substrate-binding protein